MYLKLNYRVWSMRNLWELEMSTAMSNNLQAGMGTAPRCRREQGCLHHALQTGTVPVHAESSYHRFPLFPITTMSCHPENCCCTSWFATIYNKLTGGGGGCLSPPECRPSDPSFLPVCLLSFLNLPLLPVRFLGWGRAGGKTQQWKYIYSNVIFLILLFSILFEKV
jgi:hypothetical protein